MEHWDLIVVGAGPAGLTASVYGARSGLKTLVLEEKIPGGLTAEAPLIENYPGFPAGVSGIELTARLVKHAEIAGAQIHELEKVTTLNIKADNKLVKTDKTVYTASTVILASGCHYKRLGVLGENEFLGRGLSYCALCDGTFFKEKKVIVVGGGNSAAISAIHLSNLTSDVKLAHRRDQLRAEKSLVSDLQKQQVEVLWNTEVKAVKGDVKVRSVILLDNKTGVISEMEVDGVFVQIGEEPNSQVAKEAGIEVDKEGYIIVDYYQKTNVEGVYAAGDVTICPVKQIGTAVGQAIIAATEAFSYIKRPYYYNEISKH